MFFARPARVISHAVAEAVISGISRCGSEVKGFSLSSRVRMCLEIQLPPSPVGYVGVELGRPKIGMPEQLLNASEIGASLE
jgi:hypothetical protein